MFSLRKIPVKNLRAHPARTWILMTLTAVQVLCVFIGVTMVTGMRSELRLAEARLGADILIYPTQAMSRISKDGLLMQGTPVQVYKSKNMLARLEDNDKIDKLSYQIYISGETADGQTICITAYDPATDFVISPWIKEGKNFRPEAGAVIIGSKVPADPAESITLFGRSWPISGHLHETGSELDETVFVSMETLRSLITAAAEAGITSFSSIDPDTAWSAALIRVRDKQDVESVTNWINIYIRKVTAIRSEAALTGTAADIRGQIRMIALIALFAWLILLLAQGIIQSILMRERKKELFVWHTIGATRSKLRSVILGEAFLTHLCGAFAGILIGSFLLLIFAKAYLSGAGITVTELLYAAGISMTVSIAVGCLSTLAALAGTLRTIRKENSVCL